VFGMNGPISAAPPNYIWMRTATLDLYADARARASAPAPLVVERSHPRLDSLLPVDAELERVAAGFEFTEGPVWSPDGALLFSSPNTNAIYRLDPQLGKVTLFRPKSGYTGTDIGRFSQPGSNGLTFDPDGRLVLCQHGNRRVLRVNPHGDTTSSPIGSMGVDSIPPTTWSAARMAASGSPTRPLAGPAWPTTPPVSSISAAFTGSTPAARCR
jgi:gluconolactonase